MRKLLQYLGFIASDQEHEILESLQKHGTPSMRVVGRGTLTMSIADAKKSENYIRISKQMEQLINRT